MEREVLINNFLEFLTDLVNDSTHDFPFIDGFVYDNDLSDEEVELIQSLDLKVMLNNAGN